MKALKIADSMKFEIVEIPEPKADGEHVIIEVGYVGLCGSDISMWAIGGPFAGNVLGHEYVGTVIDAGPRTDLKKGDFVTGVPQNYCRECAYCKRGETHLCPQTVKLGGPGVTAQGANSRYFAMRPDLTFKLADGLDPKAAALIEPVATGHHALMHGNIKKGDKVLLIGGGIISIVTAWWCKQAGAENIVIAEINPARIEHLKANSVADKVVNLQDEETFKGLQAEMGYGFDVVFECSHPSGELFNKTIVPLIRRGGTVVQVGAMMGPLEIDFYPFLTKEIRYQACWSYTEDDFINAIKAVEGNAEQFAAHVTNVIPIEDAQATFQQLISGKTQDVKILFDPKL